MHLKPVVLPCLALSAFLAVRSLPAQSAPEEAVRNYQAALKKGEISDIVALLPPSYVRDTTALLNDFGGRMDADLWARLRGLLAQVSATLAPKAELFVDMAAQQDAPPAADVRAARVNAMRAALQSLGALAQSDALSLQRLKAADVETLTKEIAPLFTDSTAAFQTLQTKDPRADPEQALKVLKSEKLPSGNVALTFAGGDGQTGEPTEFTQVEGRWVPAEMAQSWSESVQKARSGIRKLDFTTPEGQQQKAQYMMVMNMLDPMVQQLATAQTVEQLQQMAGGLMMPLMMMGAGMGGGAPGGSAAPPTFPAAP